MYSVVLILGDARGKRKRMEMFPWEAYDFRLTGMEADGKKGYDKICEKKPDLVVTDVVLPGMDGLELIRRIQKELPQTVFIVTSAHVEYEYTGQAMELGIRYYLREPWEKEEMGAALQKAGDEIRKTQEERRLMREMVSRAKPQVFRDYLLAEVIPQGKTELYEDVYGIKGKVCLLSVKADEDDDYLNRFVIQNIMQELLEKKVIFKADLAGESLFLLEKTSRVEIEWCIGKLKREYRRFSNLTLQYALSNPGDFSQVKHMYEQIRAIYAFEGGTADRGVADKDDLIREFRKIEQLGTLEEVLMEISLFRARLKLRHCPPEEIARCGIWLINYLNEGEVDWSKKAESPKAVPDIYRMTLQLMKRKGRIAAEEFAEKQERMEEILILVHQNIGKRNLSLQWLATEVLYLNEEYLGRFFLRYQKEKFSDYILRVRMEMAKRLLQYMPELKISEVSEIVGYSADGQYFARMFRKYTGVKPSEYRRKKHL